MHLFVLFVLINYRGSRGSPIFPCDIRDRTTGKSSTRIITVLPNDTALFHIATGTVEILYCLWIFPHPLNIIPCVVFKRIRRLPAEFLKLLHIHKGMPCAACPIYPFYYRTVRNARTATYGF